MHLMVLLSQDRLGESGDKKLLSVLWLQLSEQQANNAVQRHSLSVTKEIDLS